VQDGESESEIYPLLVEVTPDTTPPVLTLSGTASATVTEGTVYQDAGASAFDDLDGDISDRIGVDGTVDTTRPSVYTLTYSVTDLAGNTASAQRIITVSARPTSHGGGGGGMDPLLLFVTIALHAFAVARRADSRRLR
jgi:hypothetical protein